MVPDSVRRDAELARDCVGRKPGCEQVQHLPLAGRERRRLVRGPLPRAERGHEVEDRCTTLEPDGRGRDEGVACFGSTRDQHPHGRLALAAKRSSGEVALGLAARRAGEHCPTFPPPHLVE